MSGRAQDYGEMRWSAAFRCCRVAILDWGQRGREATTPKGRRCPTPLGRQGLGSGQATLKRASPASSGPRFIALSQSL